MIMRMWRGLVATDKAAEYVEVVRRTGFDDYRATSGNVDAQLLTRDLGDGRTEIMTLSWWSELDNIRAFAGENIEVAQYYPEDDDYLLDRDPGVRHFVVH